LRQKGVVKEIPVSDYLSAISVGIVDNQILLDLEYEEDSRAEVDMNFVMTGSGLFIEVQGTAERVPFNKEQLDLMTQLAVSGIQKIIDRQKEVVGDLRV
jgi:ribonuclease PH